MPSQPSRKRSIVNAKEIQRKSWNVDVQYVSPAIYYVQSHDSADVHRVILKRVHTVPLIENIAVHAECNCMWGLVGEGCKHSMAVLRHAANMEGRDASFYDNYDNAINQKHPVIRFGSRLYVVLRKVKVRESE